MRDVGSEEVGSSRLIWFLLLNKEFELCSEIMGRLKDFSQEETLSDLHFGKNVIVLVSRICWSRAKLAIGKAVSLLKKPLRGALRAGSKAMAVGVMDGGWGGFEG